MLRNLTRALALSALLLTASGCKIILLNAEGGLMASLSGSRDCVAPNVCIHEVNDDTFSETWTAVPDPLWEFVRWSNGTDFVCAGSTNPVCTVSSVGTAGIPLAEAIIASEKSYYLMPIFQPIPGVPITQTITVQGVEWAQPALFLNLTWNEINAVCPGGACSGELNGFIMDGWTFATLDDVNALFNFYLGAGALGPGPDSYFAPLGTLDVMWEAGWTKTWTTPSDAISGRVRDFYASGQHYTLGGQEETNIVPFGLIDFFVALPLDDSTVEPGFGAWFYRTPGP